MANRRNKQLDGPVNPAIIGGMIFISDEVTVDDGAVVTITFPAKTIFMVMVQTSGNAVGKSKSVSNGVGTVTLTAVGAGTIAYIITASVTEEVADLDIGAAATYTINPVQ